MSNLIIPRTDRARMAALQALHESVQRSPADTPPGGPGAEAEPVVSMATLVPQAMALELETLEPTFRSAYTDLTRVTFLWKDAIKAAGATTDQLRTCVKDVWTIMQRRVRRLDLPPEVVTRYQLPTVKNRQPEGGRRQWLPIARNLLIQMEEAEAMGGAPFTDPGTEELASCLTEAEAALARLSEVSELRKQVQGLLAGRRREVNALYRRLAACVKAGLAGESPSRLRDVMRAMGFRFEDAETPEPEAPAATDEGPVPESQPAVGLMPLIPTPAPAG